MSGIVPEQQSGGGTQYTDGAASPSNPVGTMPVFNNGGVITAVSGVNPLPVTASLPSGAATAAKQDAQTALLTTLNSLIETNNTLINLLSPLAAAMNSGAPALRVAPISSQSTAVTGTLTGVTTVTTVSTLTNFGTGIPAKEMADDMNNLVATMANINNVTA